MAQRLVERHALRGRVSDPRRAWFASSIASPQHASAHMVVVALTAVSRGEHECVGSGVAAAYGTSRAHHVGPRAASHRARQRPSSSRAREWGRRPDRCRASSAAAGRRAADPRTSAPRERTASNVRPILARVAVESAAASSSATIRSASSRWPRARASACAGRSERVARDEVVLDRLFEDLAEVRRSPC